MNYVVESYENYKEENRLTTNNARRIEFITTTDITPRHIDIINQALKNKSYDMDTAVLDATDMSCFADDSFDVVLNMGPFYHLTTEKQRKKCMKECLRVLKKGGLLVTAYIPRYYIF